MAVRAGLCGYRLVDYLTQGYIALAGLVVLVFHGTGLPFWPLYLAAHLAAMAGIHWLIQMHLRHENHLLRLVRSLYPIALYSFLYTETHVLDMLIQPHYLDLFFIRADQRLFGFQPSVVLMKRLPYLWLSEVFYLSYFLYYLMVLGVGLKLYFKDRRSFFHYVTAVSFVFYVCYAIYIVLPVMGPHGNWVDAASAEVRQLLGDRHPPAAVTHGPFFNVMKLVYALVEPVGGAAFPSSHVAVAIATLYFTWRYWRPMRWVHLVAVVLLCISTVYCGYHYAVDVAGGAVTAAVLLPIVNFMFRKAGEFELDPSGRPAQAARQSGGSLPA